MDWDTYRSTCDRGDVLSRWLLVHSAELLENAGCAELAARLRTIPEEVAVLPRPPEHLGGQEADFFVVSLEPSTVREIAAQLAELASDPDRRLASGRGLGGMAEAWAEFRDWLDGTHPRSPARSD